MDTSSGVVDKGMVTPAWKTNSEAWVSIYTGQGLVMLWLYVLLHFVLSFSFIIRKGL